MSISMPILNYIAFFILFSHLFSPHRHSLFGTTGIARGFLFDNKKVEEPCQKTELLSFACSFFSRFDTDILETPKTFPISSIVSSPSCRRDQLLLLSVQLRNGIPQIFKLEVSEYRLLQRTPGWHVAG